MKNIVFKQTLISNFGARICLATDRKPFEGIVGQSYFECSNLTSEQTESHVGLGFTLNSKVPRLSRSGRRFPTWFTTCYVCIAFCFLVWVKDLSILTANSDSPHQTVYTAS